MSLYEVPLYIGFVLSIFKYRISLIQHPYEVGIRNTSLYIRRLELRGFDGFGIGHTLRVRSQCRSQIFFCTQSKCLYLYLSARLKECTGQL